MKKMWNNLPISSKLLVSIGAILAIFTISLGIDFLFTAKQAATVKYSATTIWETLNASLSARRNLLGADDIASYAFITNSAKERTDYLKQYRDEIARVQKAIDKLNSEPLDPKERETVANFSKWLGQYDASNQQSFDLLAKGKKDAAGKAFLAFPTDEGQKLVNEISSQATAKYSAANDSMVAGSVTAEIVTIVAGIVSIVLGFLVALFLGRSISSRLNSVTDAIDEIVRDDVTALVGSMKQLAGGDLTAKVSTHSKPLDVDGNDEPARLANAYNSLLTGMKNVGSEFSSTTELLGSMVVQIKASVEQVNTAAGEIAEGSANLSQRTEEQASGLEETASSMEEFTATVKQNAQNAQEANTLGSSAQDQARKSGEVMHDVVATMEKINSSSQKIVEIISVIDGIAFQTNILALNAAVEAARAGEQGRGFAVVAGEVRSLAQRSSAAAKEIKELIGDTVSKVSDGSTLVEQAGATMDELVDSVQRVTTILGDIAAASREQSSGIDQVNKAITQMDEVTQQNAALVEEAAAAAGSLEEQARSLMTAVGTFKVEAAALAQPAPAPARPQAVHRETATRKPHVARPTTKTHSNGKAAAAAASESDWETF